MVNLKPMINLLPPQYKQELKKEENLKLVLILGIIFLIFLISLTLILLAIKIYIGEQVESLKFLIEKEREKSETRQNLELREKIEKTSQTISKLESFYEEKIYFSAILENIFQTIPEGVYLTSLTIVEKENIAQISLSGFAPTREILFELKNNLESKKQFSEINFPPQNWLKPTNIDFTATFKIKF
jgi:Tfp pilus assembly protein PilN